MHCKGAAMATLSTDELQQARIDLAAAFARKMMKNEAKYPIEKARGRAEKYTDL